MSWIVPLAVLGLAALIVMTFASLAGRRQARAAAPGQSTQVGPRILIHDINDDRCTGCDACVAVCPTNVLDLVENKSRVLRFQDCIQCELCMHACPTEALVMFPEGSEPPPLSVPELDEYFQTAVPGQYLIGEVAGKPLVKNAANLGRLVVEHMLRTGLAPRPDASANRVDVAIVGSGPGGLSAALSCRQRGLSYVVIEKEQMLATTVARYPKGKLVMAEPYDVENVSLLPVFDSSKEELVPLWRELVERVGLQVNMGESVDTVTRIGMGAFDVRTNVGAYQAQRVVLAVGTRGRPRTLQVLGENLPKVSSLLEDPDPFRNAAVLVVGGGDSAVEAAVALADGGARVMLSYRGRGFNRCGAKNKQAIESYANEGRVKVKLQSQVVEIEPEAVVLQLSDGTQKRYNNDAVFVLIGADPPIPWLEKMGIRFVKRPHQYQLGKTDQLVRRFLPQATACPEDAARASAAVLGGSVGIDRAVAAVGFAEAPGPSAPRRWLRAATNLIAPARAGTNAGRAGTNAGRAGTNAPASARATRGRDRKMAGPMPLSEFARGKSQHTGRGRRDALSPSERTRVLRMLRDEGGRLADEDSHVVLGNEFDSNATVVPSRLSPRPVQDANPAVIVGLAEAQARGPSNRRSKRPSEEQPLRSREPQPPARAQPSRQQPAPSRPQPAPSRQQPAPSRPQPAPSRAQPSPSRPQPSPSRPQPSPSARRGPPPPFSEEPTRQVSRDELRSVMGEISRQPRSPFDEDATRHVASPPSGESGTTARRDVGNGVRVTGSIDLGPMRENAEAPRARAGATSRRAGGATDDADSRAADQLRDVEWDLD